MNSWKQKAICSAGALACAFNRRCAPKGNPMNDEIFLMAWALSLCTFYAAVLCAVAILEGAL
jgi:hypothetical protein